MTILTTTSGFSHFPFSGRIVPELGDESIREWFAYSYRVIYRVEDEIVTVAAIVHGRRLLELE
jgi:toxin ParE1/3/4